MKRLSVLLYFMQKLLFLFIQTSATSQMHDPYERLSHLGNFCDAILLFNLGLVDTLDEEVPFKHTALSHGLLCGGVHK